MNILRMNIVVSTMLGLSLILMLLFGAGFTYASHTSTDPQVVGQLSPLIPFPKDAIHAGFSLSNKSKPKICFGMRPTEYRGFDIVDENNELREIFEQFVYGGFGFSEGTHGLDESNVKGDRSRENFMCWDLTHPDAFNDTGEFAILDGEDNELVTKADFSLNAASFRDAGHSKGLNYNVFCSGNVALADGRWLFIGGHDKSGNNAIRKLSIFNPFLEKWVSREMPQVKKDWLADPDGNFPDNHADARDEQNTDPHVPSDMKYQRWYPSGVVLPNKKVLLLSGTDQETSLGPPATQFFPSCAIRPGTTACSKVRILTPEIYNPKIDRTVALESAQKLLMMFPRSYVVQTGPKRKDWKVAVIGEANPEFLPTANNIGQYDPWFYHGKTYLLDVQAAVKDPNRDTANTNHWHHIATAKIAHNNGAGAQLWETDHHGKAVAQKVVLFGGDCGSVPRSSPFVCDQSAVEMIDYEDANPSWKLQEPLILPANQNNAVVLPTGKVLIVGGTQGRGPWVNTFHLQLFNPYKGTITPLVETKIARHDHSTVALLQDGSVAILGGNATDLSGDHEETDKGIPVAQIYKPAYFYNGPRPVIQSVPQKLIYGNKFITTIKSGEGSYKIKSVAIIRMGPVTHNWDWGNRYVKLWFKQEKNRLVVQAPKLPGLAIPGYYQLFIVNDKGVPSMSKVIHLDG